MFTTLHVSQSPPAVRSASGQQNGVLSVNSTLPKSSASVMIKMDQAPQDLGRVSSFSTVTPITKRPLDNEKRSIENWDKFSEVMDADFIGELELKERKRKDFHNMVERRRRYNMNDKIKELGSLLPKSPGTEGLKQNKGYVLRASVDYVRMLQHKVSQFQDLEQKQKEASENEEKLKRRIKWFKELEQELNDRQEAASLYRGYHSCCGAQPVPCRVSGQNCSCSTKRTQCSGCGTFEAPSAKMPKLASDYGRSQFAPSLPIGTQHPGYAAAVSVPDSFISSKCYQGIIPQALWPQTGACWVEMGAASNGGSVLQSNSPSHSSPQPSGPNQTINNGIMSSGYGIASLTPSWSRGSNGSPPNSFEGGSMVSPLGGSPTYAMGCSGNSSPTLSNSRLTTIGNFGGGVGARVDYGSPQVPWNYNATVPSAPMHGLVATYDGYISQPYAVNSPAGSPVDDKG